MSTHSFEVAIVSAFGRGELLAGELKTRGMDVALIDVSTALGARSLADLEGPFPIVRPSPLLPAHLEWLMSHSFDEIPHGMCLWLQNGPIEFRGPLANFYSETKPEVRRFREHFADWSNASSKRSDLNSKLMESPFDERWITEFAYSFCAREFFDSPECHLSGEPFPLTQLVQIPIFVTERIEKIQDEVRATGVKWFKAEGLSDIAIERGQLRGLEVNVGASQVLQARHFVWCLSSEETASLSKTMAEKLFPRGIVAAKWAWRRFQVHSPKNSLDAIVPAYVVLMDDLHFPWAFDNMIVLKKRKAGLSDIWVRLPAENSRKPDQLKKFTGKLEEKLRERFRGLQHTVESFWDEGPPLYPVFEPDQLRGFGKLGATNMIFEGPEVLARQDWAGRFQMQAGTMLRLQLLKQQEMNKRKKDSSHDTALHAP